LASVIELELDDGSIVEFEISQSPGDSLEYAGAGERVRKKAEEFFTGSLTSVLKLMALTRSQAIETLQDASSIEITFALGINGGGDLKVISGEANASVSITVSWEK
jgi:hypothetical protein